MNKMTSQQSNMLKASRWKAYEEALESTSDDEVIILQGSKIPSECRSISQYLRARLQARK
jgi:hypothetical protein